MDYDGLVRMLRGAAATIRESHETLSRLDSHGGDGDHGTTMLRAMAQLEQAIDAAAGLSIADLLHDIGWAVMGVDGGATGPLFGAFFLGMSAGVPGASTALDAGTLAAMFDAGVAAVQKHTRARLGDKTLMDALLPAVEAMQKAAQNGADIAAALRQTAEAATQGAASTEALQARFGRAKHIGEKSVGAKDPGATSVALMFEGFCAGAQ